VLTDSSVLDNRTDRRAEAYLANIAGIVTHSIA
jgi:hypothetical protein